MSIPSHIFCDDAREPLWHRGPAEGWAHLRAMAKRDRGGRSRVDTEVARKRVQAMRAEIDVFETKSRYACPRVLLHLSKTLWALQALLWARVAINMRADARERFLADPEGIRAVLGGLTACERWWRRTLAMRLRFQLRAECIPRYKRLVEWRKTEEVGKDVKTREVSTDTLSAATYSDGTPRIASTRDAVLARTEAAWRMRALGGRRAAPKERGAPDLFQNIPTGVRLARVQGLPRPPVVADIVFVFTSAKRRPGFEGYLCLRRDPLTGPPHKARALPAIELTPWELGWTPDMTADLDDTAEMGEDAAETRESASEEGGTCVVEAESVTVGKPEARRLTTDMGP